MEEVPGLSADAYSQDSHNVAATVEYSLNESTFLALGLLGRHGDVVSTTRGSAQIYAASRALAEDPAFGPEAYAYKLTGTTYGFRLGISYSPTPHSLLGCGFEHLETHADGGNRYTKSIPEITWVYRF
jgi:long-subunit fatty acid transport protein